MANFRKAPDIIRELERKFGYDGNKAEYLVNVSQTAQVLYFEVPKTGCTAVKLAMQHVERPDKHPGPTEVHNRKTSPLALISQLDLPPGEIFRGPRYYRFTFVRNPYSRVLSGYLDKIVKNEWERKRHLPALGFPQGSHPTFLEFLERIKTIPVGKMDVHWMPQSTILNPDYVKFDDIFRFETFSDDFEMVKNRLKISRSNWSIGAAGTHHRTNASELLSDFYSDREIEIVNQLYAKDFEVFGYEAGGLKRGIMSGKPSRQRRVRQW